ncbi:E3 ubiquitin-protein ligase RGLG2-like protein, putative [Medicago truncatula]|uniref:E3 ubiquitin-protein ligase RGLG2-like protein, putative n=1 Tax=Medicago truncatula TaxID=3880 RepID=G7K4A3_MEDTR|nr:E3 ubiquitin-protein ligase RGLG2-like protein, putative [Medicago truncatula]
MATLELGILGNRRRRSYIHRITLPPTQYGAPSFYLAQTSNQISFHPSAPPQEHGDTTNPYFFPICLTNPKDMAFGCGHQIRKPAT